MTLRILFKDIDTLLSKHKALLLGAIPVFASGALACVTFGAKVVAPIVEKTPPDYRDERDTLRRRNAELDAQIAKLASSCETPSLQFNNVQGALAGNSYISLENKGNGAAYIQTYAWAWRGQRVLGEGAAGWDTLHHLLGLRVPLSIVGGYLERGDVLRSNESFRAFKLDSKSPLAMKDYKRALSEVSLVVCYCKDRELKDECWKEVLSPMGVAPPDLDCEAPEPDPRLFTATTTPSRK